MFFRCYGGVEIHKKNSGSRVRVRFRVRSGLWCTKTKLKYMVISVYMVLDREVISKMELRGPVYRLWGSLQSQPALKTRLVCVCVRLRTGFPSITVCALRVVV